MAKKQFYGIKYPFTSQDEENYFIDVNKDIKSKIKSLLIHVIFTPKGQKIRDLDFGTNLVKYIYEPNDSTTWDEIKREVNKVVAEYVDDVIINEITILPPDENRHDILVRVDYTINHGMYKETDNLITKI